MKDYLTPVKVFLGFEPDVTFRTDMGEVQEHKTRKTTSVIPFKSKHEVGESEIWVFEPRTYEESQDIASHLCDGQPVIINLKYLERAVSQRLVDFLCGTMFAIDGSMRHLGENIFLFSPATVQIKENSR